MRELLEIDEVLASDELGDNDIVIDRKANPESLLSCLLRTEKGRPLLAKQASLLGDAYSFTTQLEEIRNSLDLGDIVRARRVEDLVSTDGLSVLEKSEFLVEKVRRLVLEGEMSSAVDLAQKIFRELQLSGSAKMTLHQLVGHALLVLNDLELSITHLQDSRTLSLVFPNAQSGYSARAFLVVVFSRLMRLEDAEKELEMMELLLKSFRREDFYPMRLLIFARAKVHYLNSVCETLQSGDRKDEDILRLEALALARWLGNADVEKKCLSEISKDERSLSCSEIVKFQDWTFLKRHHLILNHLNHGFKDISESPLIAKMIEVLQGSPLTSSDFFEKTWCQKYFSNKHATHVRANLSKIRKLVPTNSLYTKNGFIYLR